MAGSFRDSQAKWGRHRTDKSLQILAYLWEVREPYEHRPADTKLLMGSGLMGERQ